jgi:RHS repeat-associated protein
VNCITSWWGIPPVTTPIPLPFLPSDISLGIYTGSNLTAILTNQEKNINSTILTKDALDPVDLATGDFRYSNTLMHLAWDGMNYDLGVSYKSQVEYSGPLGYNWDHTYNKRLIENTGGSVTYTDGKLGKYTFLKNPDGSYEYMNGLNVALAKTANGTYQMEFKNGDVYDFNSDLRITKVTNSQNKSLAFSYSSGNLAKVTDTLGRDIIYSYTQSGLLERVTEPGGRQVNLTYFASWSTLGNEWDLENIQIKNWTDEKNIGFTYSKNTDTKLAHNILTMTDSKWAIYVTNTYDTNDRVITQKYGDHTGSYEYTTQDIHADDTLSTIWTGTIIGNYVTRNRARDRSGNITDYTYNRMGNVLERTSAGLATRYTYDSKWQLTSEILPSGNGTSYTYDTLGNKTTIRKKVNMQNPDASADIVTTMTYTGAINTIESIVDPLGNLTAFESDARGNITKITKHATANTPESIESFVYNTAGHLTSKTDANGNITTYEYNQIGKPTKVTRAKNTSDEASTNYTYDNYGNPLTETDGRGNTKTLSYDNFDRLASSLTSEGIRTRYLSDANNNKTRTTLELSANETVITDTAYNLLDKPTTITADIDANRRASISYTYDADDRLLTTTYPNGQREKRTYDTLGRLTAKEIIGATTRTTSYTYDNNSNVTSETIDGLTSTFTYDGYDRLSTSTDANGTITTMSYDKNGNILESVVRNQAGTILKKTTTEYNRDNHPTKLTEYGSQANRITTRIYDTIGNVVSETNGNNQTTTYTYDSLNRTKTTTLPNGIRTENTYDKAGNITKQQVISPDKTLTTTSTYDRDNRKTSTTDASGNITSYVYNKLGQIIQTLDPKWITTTYTYDYRGKITTETRANKIIARTYDLMGNLTTLTDANGNTTTYTYNGNNELTSEKLPDNTTTTYTYDTRGNIATKTDPNGTTITYTYDNLNRIVRKDIEHGTWVEWTTYETYSYDEIGRLKNSTDSTGKAISFAYDRLGNLTSETNGGKVVNYTYDLLGNKLTTQTPNNRTIANTYDILNRITAVKQDNVNVATYIYDPLNLTKETLANGIQTNYGYDGWNRMSQIGNDTIAYDPNSNITKKGTDTYVYDQLNQITQAKYTDKRYGTMEWNGYNYDLMWSRQSEENLRWITKTTRTGAVVTTERKKIWNYTPNTSNQYIDILAQSGTVTNTGTTSTGVTDSGSTSSWVTNTGTTDTGSIDDLQWRLLYDKNGNLIGNVLNLKKEYEYTYDYNNRLIQVSRYNSVNLKEVLISFSYDTLWRRATKKVWNSLIEYIYSGNDVIEETLSTVSATTGVKIKKELREYIYGSRGMDDIIATTITPYTRLNKVDIAGTPNTYYYEKDHLGSITKITSSTGWIVDEYSYTVFGKAYKKDILGIYKPVSSLKSTINNTRLYTWREYDRETNLYYLRARYYDANLGRFISRDPIGMQDDINLYKYTRNSPLNYTDRIWTIAKQVIATLTIYSRANNWIWHSWIEITKWDNTTTYGLWPDRWWSSEPDWNLPQIYDWVQINWPETSYTKDRLDSSASMSMQMNQEQLNKVNSYIASQIEDWRKWHEWSPCSAFASDVWNSVAVNKLEDRNLFWLLISTPLTLRNSIILEKTKDFPFVNFLLSNLN